MTHATSTTQAPKQAEVCNPATGNRIGSIAIASTADVENALLSAIEGRGLAASLSRHERADILLGAATLLKERREKLAQTIVAECGKPIAQALKETDRCINTITLSAGEAKRIIGAEIPFDSYHGLEDRFGYYTKEPIGIVLAITPFNDPLNLVAHKVGPAIAAGCACILKPALETPYSALALADCLFEAGLPAECLQVVLGDGAVGDQMVRDDRIAMVSFTGGAQTGEIITKNAGLKRITMDLGGNAPVFVMPDADLDAAATECVSGAFWAAGQNCIGVQRVFCHSEIFDDLMQAMVSKTDQMTLGDPTDPQTDMGPMVSENAAKRAPAWIESAISEGANCLIGNRRERSFLAPTILTKVPENARVLYEEVFAPIVCLVPFDDLDAALAEANAPEFLLHGTVFTNDMKIAQKICRELKCAGIMVNDSSDFRFDGMPFGGSKRGSLGREGVKFAIEEMTSSKTVCFKF